MATLAFSIAGGALGQSLLPAGVGLFGQTLSGAAVGQALGGAAGAVIDNVLFAPGLPRPRLEGPRLAELRIGGSEYGTAIPLAFGATNRIAGNVVWISPVEEKRQEKQEGGKGGGGGVTTVRYSYYLSLAVGLCAGPIRAVTRVWADSRPIWEEGDAKPLAADALRVLRGDEQQQPDPLIEAHEGVGRVPAFRGLAYAVIERLALTPFGNRLPNLTFEVALPPERCRLADLLGELCARAGVPEVNARALEGRPVNGYVVPRLMSAREAIEPLQRAFFFDLHEDGEGLVFAPLGLPALVEAEPEDLGARGEGEPPAPRLASERADPLALPRAIAVQHLDPARDHQSSLQQARRQQVDSRSDSQLQLPLLLHAGQAREVAERSLALAWQQRERHGVSLPPAYRRLRPGDGLRLRRESGAVLEARVLEQRFAPPGLLRLELASERLDAAGAYGGLRRPGAVAPVPANRPPPPPSPTRLLLLDLPALRDRDDEAGFYVALAPSLPLRPWPGAALYRGEEAEGDVERLLEGVEPALLGTAETALPPGPVTHWDRAAALELLLDDPAALLESRSEAQVLAGRNALLLGAEILQFAEAEALGGGRWRLTRMLRGRLGTEAAVSGHAAGETAVLLDGGGLLRLPGELAALGLPRHYRAATLGTALELVEESLAFAAGGRALRPWSPVHLRGRRDPDGGLQLRWVRRSRLDRGWRDEVETALDEAEERYRLQVLDAEGAVRRSLETTLPAWLYGAAEQAADFGAPQAAVRLRVAQLSAAVGAGDWTEAIL